MLLSGCGGEPPFAEGTHPSLPQVANLGGPVLNEPTVISVTYPGDALGEVLDSFTAAITSSAYWGVLAEYGVQSGHAGTPVHLGSMAPSSLDDAELQHDLPLELAANQFGIVPNQAIYVFYLPEGVKISNPGQVGCQDFGGYHSSVALPNGTLVAYAVIPRCTLFGLNEQDTSTTTGSHEIAEAASDPYFENQHGAWGALDPADIGWSVFPGNEVADLCLIASDRFFTPSDLPYKVQRLWSNHAASSGENPCVPADPSTTYFYSIPVLLDAVSLDLGNGAFAAQGLSIKEGEQQTVELDLFSAGATGPWNLSAQTLQGAAPVQVTFNPDERVEWRQDPDDGPGPPGRQLPRGLGPRAVCHHLDARHGGTGLACPRRQSPSLADVAIKAAA